MADFILKIEIAGPGFINFFVKSTSLSSVIKTIVTQDEHYGESNEKHEEKRFDKVNQTLTKISLFLDCTMSLMFPIMMLIMNKTTLLIVYNEAKNIYANLMGLGDMMAFIQYAIQIIMSFLMISMVAIIIPRASVSIKRINDYGTKKIL